MPDAHVNFAVSLVATAPSPATSGTSLVVTAADGAKFPAVPFNATIWPAGANPTSSTAEVVRVTARSTDTLTITRAQESSSARTVIVGDQIAATMTAKTLTDAEVPFTALAPTGAIAETIPRASGAVIGSQAILLSQRLSMQAIFLTAGVKLTSVSFVSGSAALASGNHQIFGVYDDSSGSSSGTARALLRGTSDDGATAWGAGAVKTLNLTSTYTPTRTGLHYLGVLVDATTVPTLQASSTVAGIVASTPPILVGTSSTTVTALPNPAAAIAATALQIWAWVS